MTNKNIKYDKPTNVAQLVIARPKAVAIYKKDCFAYTRNDTLRQNQNAHKKVVNLGHSRKGFGLLEVLLSGVIIIIILGAMVFIGRAAMKSSASTQERAQATYIAQEGLEIVRQIRDTNWTDGDNTTVWNSLVWNLGSLIMPTPSSTTTYGINFNNTKKRYGLISDSSDSVSINGISYTRSIKVEAISGNLLPKVNSNDPTDTFPNINALKVTATASWTDSGQSKSISASEILTNWKPNF